MKAILVAVLVAGLISACVGGLQRVQRDAAADRYLDYAGDPIQEFTPFSLSGWEPISENRLVLWNGANEAYLIRISNFCRNLQIAENIQVKHRGTTVSTADRLRVDKETCSIEQIRPIDMRQLREDRAAERAVR